MAQVVMPAWYYPTGIALDKNGNVYVTENSGNTIRKITPSGVVTTLAGTFALDDSNLGSADGTGHAARFRTPWGIAVDANGMLYVADYGNGTIRKITLYRSGHDTGRSAGCRGNKRRYRPQRPVLASNRHSFGRHRQNLRGRLEQQRDPNGVLADLKITCTDNKTTVAAGSLDTYTITVTNTGLENVNGAVVTDTFPGSAAERDLYGDGEKWRDRVLSRQRQH